MTMAEATTVAIDCAVSIVIGVIEEPVDDVTSECADGSEILGSNDAVSPDVRQRKEVVAKFLAKLDAPEPKFSEPDQRR